MATVVLGSLVKRNLRIVGNLPTKSGRRVIVFEFLQFVEFSSTLLEPFLFQVLQRSNTTIQTASSVHSVCEKRDVSESSG